MLIKATIDRFENDKAVLRTKDKQNIIWPKDKLPENTKEGSVLRIAISSDKVQESADQELARDILNEILKTAEENKI